MQNVFNVYIKVVGIFLVSLNFSIQNSAAVNGSIKEITKSNGGRCAITIKAINTLFGRSF
jgi:hypothetical protein